MNGSLIVVTLAFWVGLAVATLAVAFALPPVPDEIDRSSSKRLTEPRQ